MVRLTRAIRFSVNPPAPGGAGEPSPRPGGVVNGFAAHPSMRGLGRHYELLVACAGEVDRQVGMFYNVAEIDNRVRASALPRIDAACRDTPWLEPADVLPGLFESTSRALEGRLVGLEWMLSPTYGVAMETTDMTSVLLRQKFEFAASHRLHCEEYSDEKNREVFGKCNNPWGHGHNYHIEPVVRVPLGAGGARFTLADLERLTARAVVQRFDHKHLNKDCPEFDTGRGGLNPTVENIAKVCYDALAPEIAGAPGGASLERVTLWETEKTSCVYPG